MIEIVTPTIVCSLGFTDQVSPYLTALGALERAPGPMASRYGFTERTPTGPISLTLGFNEYATNGVTLISLLLGSTDVVRPTVRVSLGATERAVVKTQTRLGAVERAPVSFTSLVGMTERVPRASTSLLGHLERVGVVATFELGVLNVAVPDAPLAAVFSGWSFNTKKLGIGRYEGYPFNSLFKIGLNYFGISDTGIEVLDGAKDLGQPINASVLSGVSTCGTDNRKVIPDVYVEVRCKGCCKITLIYNEISQVEMSLDPIAGKEGLYFKHIKVPRGIDGTHIQVRFENVDGADFDLQTLRLITQPKTRRT